MRTAHTVHKEHDFARITGPASNIHGSHNSASGHSYQIGDFVRDFSCGISNPFIEGSSSVPCRRKSGYKGFQLCKSHIVNGKAEDTGMVNILLALFGRILS